MTSLVFDLGDPAAQNPAMTGSKGASLAKMTAAGLRVPPGFVVTTEVFADSLGDRWSEIHDALSDVRDSDLDALQIGSGLARRILQEAGLSDGGTSAVMEAYRRMGMGPVSVRSSATAEDLPGASFAGLYDSYLNVLSPEQVTGRLLDVWASLYTPRAIAYLLRNAIELSKVRMAVIVQRQLDPDSAGVLFTRDPLTGADRYVIDAARGLGEGVVAGTSQADRFVLTPETGMVTESKIVAKRTMHVGRPDGGIEQVVVPDRWQSTPVLDQSQLTDLAALGRRLTDLFGGPQDVEFSYADGALHCLQARPVTALERREEPQVPWEGGVDTRYSWRLGTMTVFYGPVYRLQQEAAEAYAAGQRTCFEETGSSMSREAILHFVNGYIYVRPPDVDEKTIADRQARHVARCQAYIEQGTSNYNEDIRPRVEETLEALRPLRRAGDSLQARVRYLDAAMQAAGLVMGHLHWCQGGMTNRLDWPAAYHEITGEPAEDAGVFLQAIPNMTTRMIRRLRELARIVQSDPQLEAIFAEGDYDRLHDPRFRQRPVAMSFHRRFKSLMRVYGFRTGWGFGASTDFDGPNWNMQPQKPLDLIASYAQQDLDELDSLEADALRERQLNTARIRRRLAREPERHSRFEFDRARAQRDLVSMEDHNHLMEQCTVGQLREAMYLMGRSMVKRRILEVPNDVLHLSIDELKAIAEGRGPEGVPELVRERKAEREERARLRPPAILGQEPAPEVEYGSNPDEPSNSGLDGNIIRGTAASRGRATGPARLVLPGAQMRRIRRGDILVAENIGPDWTPVMPLLGGIVLDGGAVSQHAALVAREYRIPAVILTGNATTSILDGQTITVDGDSGIVELDV